MNFIIKHKLESSKTEIVLHISSNKKQKLSTVIQKDKGVSLGYLDQQLTIQLTAKKSPRAETRELHRKAGHLLLNFINQNEFKSIGIESTTPLYDFLEGFLLSDYIYKNEKKKLRTLFVSKSAISKNEITDLKKTVEAVHFTRNLVNTPANILNPTSFADKIETGLHQSIKIEILEKKQLESLKMGGILAVSQASIHSPKLAILSYLPKKNSRPIVLVGKGITYDTGGLSLKPTANSMDFMKCDMAGAAAVVGTLELLAQQSTQKNVIGIIPIADNRIGSKAIGPGDVITMFNKKTVEVMNTDAEGRLILADALAYASKYKPQLVIDIATLTGSALAAIGNYGTVFMGNAKAKTKQAIKASGEEVHERLVEFPLWEDYQKELESPVADLKNIGSNYAGSITAGKFLENFIDYEWLHLDIAGPSVFHSPDSYRTKGGTGVGVRLLNEFIKNYV